jgi:glyoxylase-like metal-dependent hydrolase (beta-lactamase superfamily II)
MIEDPDRLFATRYNHWLEDHGIGLSQFPEGSAWVRKMAGPAHRIDVTFRGGEQISLDDKHSLRVLHVPGHSDGHLALYHPGVKAVFVGDALHGNYCPTAEGKPSLPPAYFAVLAYLGTLQFLEALDIEWIYSGHWPTYHAAAAKDFLAESRRFVDKASALVMKNLENHPEGVTLLSCIAECGPAMGAWPATNQWLLMYPLHGHLLHLEQLGVTTRIEDDGHVRWRLAA